MDTTTVELTHTEAVALAAALGETADAIEMLVAFWDSIEGSDELQSAVRKVQEAAGAAPVGFS